MVAYKGSDCLSQKIGRGTGTLLRAGAKIPSLFAEMLAFSLREW